MSKHRETYKEITDKDELRDHIHKIHDFLRNRGVGIGMTALKIFNLFYALKIIDNKRNTFNPPLSSTCSWKNLRKMKGFKLIEKIVARGDSVLDELHDNPSTRDTIFYDIPRDVKTHTYDKLMDLIDQIPVAKTYDVDLAGKIYEYFIGYGDKTSMSDLGAYFTDRHITQFIMNEIKPQIEMDSDNEDIGHVPTMIDPFGGSGGFTLTYTKYMQENYGDYINWKDEIQNISHYDLSEDVVKSASLEMFVLTGIFPSVGSSGDFKRTNSFEHNYGDKKYMYIISNPPYGGDKNKKNAEQQGIDKLIAKIKADYMDEDWADDQLKALTKKKALIVATAQKDNVNINSCNSDLLTYAQEFGVDKKDNPTIKANDKEACSLLLFMYLLEKNGTCVGVLKEGVFFDAKYSELRKALIENFNVEQVISVPSDQFENTTTKTSIIIFKNNGRTKKVVFSDLKINKYEEDIFEVLDQRLKIVHQSGQIKEDNGVEKVYVSEATYDDIVCMEIKGKCQYSLNAKKYNSVKVECSDKYKLVKISDVMCYLEKSKRLASFGSNNGKYIFYRSGVNVGKCDIADYNSDNYYIIIGSGGYGSLYLDKHFTCSSDNFIITSVHTRDEKIHNLYNYFVLQTLWDDVKYLYHGSKDVKHLRKDDLNNFQIPVPKSEKLLKEWVKKISTPYDAIQEKKKELAELEQEVRAEVQRIGDEEECDMMTLGDLCEYIKTGKNKTPDDKKGTKYPYYGTACITGYTDYYLFEGEHLLIARNGTMGNVFYTNGKIYPSDHIFAIKNKKEHDIKYMYYQLVSKATEIDKASNGSTIKGISLSALEKINIPVPLNKKLIKALEPKFEQIEQLNQEIKEHEEEYKSVLKELSENIKKPSSGTNNTKTKKKVDADDSESSQDDDSSESKIKKRVVKKKKDASDTDDEGYDIGTLSKSSTKRKVDVKKTKDSDKVDNVKVMKNQKKIKKASSDSEEDPFIIRKVIAKKN